MNAEAKPLKCGLIMPISAIDGCSEAHWDEVRIIIKEALADTPFVVELVSDSNEIGIIQKRIVQNIYDNDIVVCDVSAKNPNVMFELGMRLAFDKPAIIIKDDKTNYSFDTSPIEHLQYPRDLHYHAIQAFKVKLREKVLATYAASKGDSYTTFLKNFGQFVVAKIDEKPVGKEEFILEAISEIRSELRSIAKTQGRPALSISRAIPVVPPASAFDDLNEDVKINSLIVRNMISGEHLLFGEDGEPNSEAIEKMVDERMRGYSGAVSSHDAERIRIYEKIKKQVELLKK